MTDIDIVKEILQTNNVNFEEITENELDFEKKIHELSQTTLVVNNFNELWAFKLRNSTPATTILHALSNFPHLLTKLQHLDISGNKLGFLPDWIQNLVNLKYLNISHNELGPLSDGGPWSDGIQKLTNLQTLDPNNKANAGLPDWIQKLTNLQTLNISGNGLEVLPDGIQKLTNLKYLNISHNNLWSLPDGIQKLANLRTLHIYGNKFQTIPHSLLPFLQKISVPTNDLIINDTPDVVVKQGWKAVSQYYADDQKTLAELKVMIIGAGGSGKSCISKMLKDKDQYVHTDQKPTVGIELSDVEHTFRGEQWSLRIWDFGGQQAYTAAQTMFMTEQTLYLVVADGRAENRPDPYLHYVSTVAPNSPIILIISKIDNNERADLNRQRYLNENKYPNVYGEIIKLSCCVAEPERSRRVNELFTAIEDLLFNKKYEKYRLHISLGSQWLKVKNDLATVIAENGKHVDVKIYNEICAKHGLSLDEGENVRGACNCLGEIFSYRSKDPRHPIDWIMHPNWVTKGVNCLYGLSQGGFYKTAEICSYMEKHGYTLDEINAILDMLIEKNLAFHIQSSEQFFVPALLPVENSKFPDKSIYTEQVITDENVAQEVGRVMNNREIRFRYPFLQHSVKQVFMVKLYEDGVDLIPCRDSCYWKRKNVRVVMMEETDELAFYLKSDNAEDLSAVQVWIQERMDDINRITGMQSCELWHVFHVKDKQGNKRSKQYSHEDLCTFLDYGIVKIPLQGIRYGPSIVEILKGLKPSHNEKAQNMEKGDTYNIHNYGPQQQMAFGSSLIINNYPKELTDVQYAKLQEAIRELLAKQDESTKLDEDENQTLKEITGEPDKKKGWEKYTSLLNAGTAVINLLSAILKPVLGS